MRRTLFTLAIALLSISLSALAIQIPDADARHWSLDQLRGLELQAFQTTRVKGIEKVEDTWMGIDLLPWLNSQSSYFWHELEFVSVDAHSLKMHRADLETKPVWLAIKDSKGWLEEGIRLVFPGQRDNIWIRGLDKIILQGFTPVPAPRRIYGGDDVRLPQDDYGIINPSDLIGSFFAETKGDLLLVSTDLKPLVLRYPEHLSAAYFVVFDGRISLQSKSLPASLLPNPIIYMQIGHQAVILPQYLERLPELAKQLEWPETLSWKVLKPSYERFDPGKPLPQGSWLERY